MVESYYVLPEQENARNQDFVKRTSGAAATHSRTPEMAGSTELIVEDTKDGVLLRAAKPFPPTTHEEVTKILKYQGKPKSLEEMDAAIAKGVKERHARGRY